jgi:putative phosphoesterase
MEKTSSVAALYDVHGNLPALEAVLSDLEDIDHSLIVVGGDVASGPMPAEVLDRLQAIDDRVRWVRGNADREVVSAYDRGSATEDARSSDPALRASGWSASRIGHHHRDLMASFEEQVTVEVEGLGTILFCHATPNSDVEVLTTATPDTRLRGILSGMGQDVVVCGHVHTQYDRRLDDRRVINAGSVGLPTRASPPARSGRCSATRGWSYVAAITTSGARSTISVTWATLASRTSKRPSWTRLTPRGWPTTSSVRPDLVHEGTHLLAREEVSQDEAGQETKIGCATISC